MTKKKEDFTKQEWYKDFKLSQEIYKKSKGDCLDSKVLCAPIPFKLAKKWLVMYDEDMIAKMVGAVLNKDRGNIAKSMKYILTLPKNHKHRKYFEKHLNWIIKGGEEAEASLKKAWDDKDIEAFRRFL